MKSPSIMITNVTLSAKTRIVRISMHIEKREISKLFMKLCMLLENNFKDWWGQQSAKGASNQQKLYGILFAWLWRDRKSLFCFRSLNGKYVTCVCLQCGRRKQNCYCFLGKTSTIDKCTISLRIISIAYLLSQSLVNISS